MENASRRAGFTLVELLSVVAIVGLLAALLLPGVGAARDKARAAVCVSQLRQLSQAALTYLNDHGAWPGGTVTGYFLWNGANYVGAGHLLSEGRTSLGRLFYCPAGRMFVASAADTGLQNLGQPGNMTVGGYLYRGGNSGLPSRPDSVPVAWLADICFSAGAGRNHAGGLNAAFTDGHVAYVPRPGHWDLTVPGAWEELDQQSR